MRDPRDVRVVRLAALVLGLSMAVAGCDGDGASSRTLSNLVFGTIQALNSGAETIVCIPYTINGTEASGGRALTLSFQYSTDVSATTPDLNMTEISPATATVFTVVVDTPAAIPLGASSVNGTFYWQAGADLGFVGTTIRGFFTATDDTGSTVTSMFTFTYQGGNGSIVVGGSGGDDLTPGVGGSTGRAMHTAHAISSAMTDGQIAVAGGVDSGLNTQAVDRFSVDVAARSYVPAATGGATRVDHASSFFYGPQNRIHVLVTGGRLTNAGAPNASSDLYTLAPTESTTAGPSMGVGRARHAACWLPNNRVLVTGGEGIGGEMVQDPNGGPNFATSQSAQVYNPATNTFTAVTHMPFPRADHTCCLLPDGTVLVAGGRDPANPTVPLQACIYNPGTDTWTVLSNVIDRYQHTATLLVNGVCYLVGGRTVSSDLVLNTAHAYRTFPTGPAMATIPAGFSPNTDVLTVGRTQHATALLGTGAMLVVGGFDESTSLKTALDSAEIFSPAGFSASVLGVFSSINSSLAFARARHTLTTVRDGSAVAIGGVSDDSLNPASFLSSIEVYQFNNSAPVVAAPVVGSTSNAAAVTITFTLTDAENDRAFVFVRFSTDGGNTFRLASLTNFLPTVNLAPGTYSVTWNALSDGLNAGSGSVQVQVIPVCGVFGTPQTTTVNF